MTKSMALIWYSCISLSIFADLLGLCMSEVVFPEAAADGGGAVEVMVRTAGSCGDVRLHGMFFSCTVLLSK